MKRSTFAFYAMLDSVPYSHRGHRIDAWFDDDDSLSAICADWGNPSSPVYVYQCDDWREADIVGSYRHSATNAICRLWGIDRDRADELFSSSSTVFASDLDLIESTLRRQGVEPNRHDDIIERCIDDMIVGDDWALTLESEINA